MRTTLDIADDILFVAKELAKREKSRSVRWLVTWPGAPWLRLTQFILSISPYPCQTCPSGLQRTVFIPCPSAAVW